MFKAVILAGGSGKRLWPMSRSDFPKQFKPLVKSCTMLQETLNRVSNMDIDSSKIICNEEHRFIVLDQLNSMHNVDSIILEPFKRNTASAITLAALNESADTVLLVLPSDHLIENEKNLLIQ